MTELQEDATRVVDEMRALGATFALHEGALGATTWTYTAPDDAMGECRTIIAMARMWRPGFNRAFCDAINAVPSSVLGLLHS